MKRIVKKSGRLLFTMGIFSFLVFLFIPLPEPLFDVPYSTILESSDGQLLSASIASDEQWRFPATETLPSKLETCIRLYEDEYFYYHLGVNPISLFRAALQNYQAGEIVSGGSTLTMQTIRMALGNQPRTYTQKLLEVLMAIKLEALYSKREILLSYLHHAPFGGNIVGVGAAARRYYGRAAEDLSWAEAATLAVLPNSPGTIFPGTKDTVLLRKRDHLLRKLTERGFLSQDECFLATKEPMPQKVKSLPSHAYHLLQRAKNEGSASQTIPTTLNAAIQQEATFITNRHSRKLSKNQIHNAASIIIDIKSGKTLAYVGNTDNPGTHGQHVDVITSLRSPGSLLKPFLYAMALDDGLITPSRLLPDVPTFYQGFAPKNFDKKYRGAVAADEALTSSLNVPFVHLMVQFGYEKFHQNMVDLGFISFNKPAHHYGPSIILGGAETTLWELCQVYAGLVRSSQNFMSRPINNGYNKSDYQLNHWHQSRITAKNQDESDGVLRVPSIEFTLAALKKVKRPEEETGWEYFGSSNQISWKTGTSYGFRDGWAIGMNSDYLVGVWVGNADGEGRPGLTGVRAAAPLMFELFKLVGGDPIPTAPVGQPYKICRHSGMLSSPNCSEVEEANLPNYLASTQSCTYHVPIFLDETGSYQVNSSCYQVGRIQKSSRFVLPPMQSWYYRRYHPDYQGLPPFKDDCQSLSAKQNMELIYPRKYTRIFVPKEQDGGKGNVIFEAAHENKEATIFWHLNDRYIGKTEGQHQITDLIQVGTHQLTLVDNNGNEVSQRFEIVN